MSDGSAASQTCSDWTTALGGTQGRVGQPGTIASQWLDSFNSVCTLPLPVYCLEQ